MSDRCPETPPAATALIHVWYSRCDQPLSPARWQRELDSLPAAIQTQILRLRRWSDRQRALVGKQLLRDALAGYAPAQSLAQLRYTAWQRPYLEEAEVDFNLSHSGAWAICALSRDTSLGVDVEAVLPLELDSLRHWLTEAEWAAVQGKDGLRRFYEYWTCKESVMKAEGQGLSLSPMQIQLSAAPAQAAYTHVAQVAERRWFLHPLRLPDTAHVAHLACAHPQPQLDCQLRVYA